VNRELFKDDWLDEQLDGEAVRSDEDRLNEVIYVVVGCCSLSIMILTSSDT